MATVGEREEQYLLRFEDPAVAARVRAVLREEEGAAAADAEMALDWDGERKREGGGGRCLSQPRASSLHRPSPLPFSHSTNHSITTP